MAKKKSAAKKMAVAAPGLASAREQLAALAAREDSLDAIHVVLAALSEVSGLVSVSEENGDLVTVPDDLLERKFNDPKVGVSDQQMRDLLNKVILIIQDARIEKLIRKNLLDPPTAALVILDVCDMIQFWVDNPSETAESDA